MKSHGFTRFHTVVGSIMLYALLLSCTAKEPAPPLDDGARAGSVALKCYKALYISNQAETFLNARVSANSLSDEQRQQLLQLYRQHVQQVDIQHGGVNRIDFSRAEADTTLSIMQVFLKMTYTDNTQEEIVVPMVQVGNEWRMK
jgi:hypothetical protein